VVPDYILNKHPLSLTFHYLTMFFCECYDANFRKMPKRVKQTPINRAWTRNEANPALVAPPLKAPTVLPSEALAIPPLEAPTVPPSEAQTLRFISPETEEFKLAWARMRATDKKAPARGGVKYAEDDNLVVISDDESSVGDNFS